MSLLGYVLNQPKYALEDMVSPQRSYFGLAGGRYGNWSNTIPAGHAANLAAQAALVRPLDAAGNPDAAGKIIISGWGMSNPRREFQEFEEKKFDLNRVAWGVDSSVDCLNLGIQGKPSQDWADPSDSVWTTDVPALIAASPYTAEQIQVLWTHIARDKELTRKYLPDPAAEYKKLAQDIADALRQFKAYCPNLQLAFFSDLYYGWAPKNNRTHRQANYEIGFAVREVIMAQSNGDNETYGDLTIGSSVPAVDWGPYTYGGPAVWPINLYQADNLNHLDPATGEPVISALLENFFLNNVYSTGWFLGIDSFALLETGDKLLLEAGDSLLLE